MPSIYLSPENVGPIPSQQNLIKLCFAKLLFFSTYFSGYSSNCVYLICSDGPDPTKANFGSKHPSKLNIYKKENENNKILALN